MRARSIRQYPDTRALSLRKAPDVRNPLKSAGFAFWCSRSIISRSSPVVLVRSALAAEQSGGLGQIRRQGGCVGHAGAADIQFGGEVIALLDDSQGNRLGALQAARKHQIGRLSC